MERNTANCPHCGAELKPLEVEFNGHSFSIGFEPCHCEGAEAERMAAMRAEAEREVLAASERTGRIMRKAGIPKRFWMVEKGGDWRSGAYIVGPVGVGKTHMAARMAKQALSENASVKFLTGGEFLRSIRDTFGGEGSEGDILSKLRSCDLLVLDDLGKDKPTDWAVSMLFQLIDARYNEELPTVVTSQYERDELLRRLSAGEADTARAIVSRLFEMCPRIRLDGKDRRLG